MNTITLTEDQANEIAWDKSEEFTVIFTEDWDDQGKYSYRGVIFHPVNDDSVKYALNIQRCGSYHTDYDYSYELNCSEVKLVERVIQEWV